MNTASTTLEPLNIRSADNIRDIAAIAPIPPTTILRGESPHFLSIQGMHDLYTLGVRTVIDLRSDKEITRLGNGPAQPYYDSGTIIHMHADLTPTTDFYSDPEQYAHLDRAYRDTLEHGARNLTHALNYALPRAGGIYIHCAVGKDRTGMAIAAIASALGATHEDITEDYMATLPAMPSIMNKVQKLSPNPISIPKILALTNPKPDTITGMLNLIETHGNTNEWWEDHGLDLALLQAKIIQP